MCVCVCVRYVRVCIWPGFYLYLPTWILLIRWDAWKSITLCFRGGEGGFTMRLWPVQGSHGVKWFCTYRFNTMISAIAVEEVTRNRAPHIDLIRHRRQPYLIILSSNLKAFRNQRNLHSYTTPNAHTSVFAYYSTQQIQTLQSHSFIYLLTLLPRMYSMYLVKGRL